VTIPAQLAGGLEMVEGGGEQKENVGTPAVFISFLLARGRL
jgi:hypothetical protein